MSESIRELQATRERSRDLERATEQAMAVSEAPRKSANKPGVRVTGFPPNTDEDYLDLYFQKFGDVERVHMAEEGSAYIEFVNSSGKVPVQVLTQDIDLLRTKLKAVAMQVQGEHSTLLKNSL